MGGIPSLLEIYRYRLLQKLAHIEKHRDLTLSSHAPIIHAIQQAVYHYQDRMNESETFEKYEQARHKRNTLFELKTWSKNQTSNDAFSWENILKKSLEESDISKSYSLIHILPRMTSTPHPKTPSLKHIKHVTIGDIIEKMAPHFNQAHWTACHTFLSHNWQSDNEFLTRKWPVNHPHPATAMARDAIIHLAYHGDENDIRTFKAAIRKTCPFRSDIYKVCAPTPLTIDQDDISSNCSTPQFS